ncbi:MFS transporter [Streptomyces sp. NPDC001922]|uniref:MFS transporter n=1 Tax=Streptomyces sp. NPDC001922 TaxID=3364624 RepID=UPI0036D1929C
MLTPPTTPYPAAVRCRRKLGAAVICLAQLTVVLVASITNIALPSVQHALHISESARSWGVTGYMLAFGALLLPGGRIADCTGRRRALVLGLCGFAGSSALGGLAVNGPMFFAMRAGQGAFAALLVPAALSLLTVTFTDPAERAAVFGVYGAVTGAGSATGLLAGGILTQFASWRWCMFIAVPFTLLAAVMAPRVLDESRADDVRLPGLPSTLTAVLGLGAPVYGFTAAEQHGWGSPEALGAFIAAPALLAVFLLLQRRGEHPLLPLHVVAHRGRAAGLLAVGLGGLAVTGIFLLLSYYLQRGLGLSALASGLAFLPFSAGMAAAASLGGRLLPRTGPLPLMAGGLLTAAAGVLLLSRVSGGGDYGAHVLPGLLVLSAGVGPMFAAGSATALDQVGDRDAGVAGAVFNAVIEIAGALGSAVLATVVTAAGNGPAAALRGYRTAFGCSAVALAVGAVVVALVLRGAPGGGRLRRAPDSPGN